jgi:hypothetical protein
MDDHAGSVMFSRVRSEKFNIQHVAYPGNGLIIHADILMDTKRPNDAFVRDSVFYSLIVGDVNWVVKINEIE